VIAVVSSPEKAAVARGAGADVTINRHQDQVVEAVRAAAPDGVDRVIEVDFGANATIDAAVIKQDGIIAAYSSTSAPEPQVPYYPLQYRGALIRLVASFHIPPAARSRALADITLLLANGGLKPTIAATFPLDKIAAAHRLKESGTSVGNVIVMP
jgi:NADPH:quinone reductase-like Zn-dependent oxidoreductase